MSEVFWNVGLRPGRLVDPLGHRQWADLLADRLLPGLSNGIFRLGYFAFVEHVQSVWENDSADAIWPRDRRDERRYGRGALLRRLCDRAERGLVLAWSLLHDTTGAVSPLYRCKVVGQRFAPRLAEAARAGGRRLRFPGEGPFVQNLARRAYATALLGLNLLERQGPELRMTPEWKREDADLWLHGMKAPSRQLHRAVMQWVVGSVDTIDERRLRDWARRYCLCRLGQGRVRRLLHLVFPTHETSADHPARVRTGTLRYVYDQEWLQDGRINMRRCRELSERDVLLGGGVSQGHLVRAADMAPLGEPAAVLALAAVQEVVLRAERAIFDGLYRAALGFGETSTGSLNDDLSELARRCQPLAAPPAADLEMLATRTRALVAENGSPGHNDDEEEVLDAPATAAGDPFQEISAGLELLTAALRSAHYRGAWDSLLGVVSVGDELTDHPYWRYTDQRDATRSPAVLLETILERHKEVERDRQNEPWLLRENGRLVAIPGYAPTRRLQSYRVDALLSLMADATGVPETPREAPWDGVGTHLEGTAADHDEDA